MVFEKKESIVLLTLVSDRVKFSDEYSLIIAKYNQNIATPLGFSNYSFTFFLYVFSGLPHGRPGKIAIGYLRVSKLKSTIRVLIKKEFFN